MIIFPSIIAFFFGAIETCFLVGILLLFSDTKLTSHFPQGILQIETAGDKLRLTAISICVLFGVRIVYNYIITRHISHTQKKIESLIFSLHVYNMRTSQSLKQAQLIKFILTDVIDYVHMYLQPILAISLSIGAVVPIYLYFVYKYSTAAALVAVFMLFSAWVYRVVVHPKTVEYGKVLRDVKERKVHLLNDFVINYRAAYFYGLYKKYNLIFEREALSHARYYHKLTFLTFTIRPLLEFLSFALIALGFYYSSTIDGFGNSSDVVGILGVILRVLPAGASLITNISFIGYSKTPRDAVTQSLAAIPEAKQKFTDLTIQSFNLPDSFNVTKFECEHLADKARENFIGLQVKRGCRIVITGDSGVGKSTFLNALMGFNVDAQIVINDNQKNLDIKIETGVFPRNVGFVPQDTALITGTLRENICLNNSFDEELYASVVRTCMLEKIDKLNCLISSTNPNLSGGEQQRLALARALYVSPDYLVLDEGLSGLPVRSQRKILGSIFDRFPHIGIIAVMHGSELLDMFGTQVEIR